MNEITRTPREMNLRSTLLRLSLIVLLAIAFLLTVGATCSLPFQSGQQKFETREAATDALFAAMESESPDAARKVLGHEHTDNIDGVSWQESRDTNARIVEAASEKLIYEDREDGTVELLIGEAQWPFPFPLVRGKRGWYFDTLAGMEEIRDRRIGRDELLVIAIAKAYGDAQIEYADVDWDENGLLEYAQKLISTPGKRDGLFWPVENGEQESPFAQLVRDNEEYLDALAPGEAVLGYRFRILAAQGSNPPGGAYSYIVDGRMISGFALVAHPDVYGETGVMTFVTSHHGPVYQKDLGQDAARIDVFDPDESWDRIE